MKTRRISKTLSLILVLAAIAGCSASPPPATAVSWKDFRNQANNDKQISLEGYVRLPAAALVSDTMLVELYEQPEGKGETIPFSTRVGSSANQIEKPPEDYTQDDLKLHAGDGSLVGLNDKVRVSGKYIHAESGAILYAPIEIVKLGGAASAPVPASTP